MSVDEEIVPTGVLGCVVAVEQAAVLVLRVAGQVAIGRVDHLDAAAHPAGEGGDAHARRERPCRERVEHVVAATVGDARGLQRGCPLAGAEVVDVDASALGGTE